MTEYGLLQRTYALLPHIKNVVPDQNFMELDREGTILIDSYRDELKDEGDFNLLCHFSCHLWNYSRNEAHALITPTEETND